MAGDSSPVLAAIAALVVIVPVVVTVLGNEKVSRPFVGAVVTALVIVLVTLCWTIVHAA